MISALPRAGQRVMRAMRVVALGGLVVEVLCGEALGLRL